MLSSRKILVLTACAALGLSAVAAEKPVKGKSTPKKATTAKKAATPTKKPVAKVPTATPAPARATPAPETPPAPETTPKPTRLTLPLPRGLESKGVVIPYTDPTGKKTMLFRIGTGTRLDDDRVKMRDLVIETYDEDGIKEMTITLPSSQMNLATRVIAGDRNVTVERNDFQLTGDTMEFNTETKQGWVKGNVKMIIHDFSEETGDTAPNTGKKGS
ncbi:MAG: LPS export ABC transporter periplasmic protein LptC [Chthoniobacteraceae bacterium]